MFTSINGRVGTVIDCVVDATIPKDGGDNWLDTDTLNRAKNLPNVTVVADRSGIEAAAFGATTSGFVMLFDQRGTCQYAGGVTESRGHEGDNSGLDVLQQILCNEIHSAEGLPAFGCRLCLPDSKVKPKATVDIGAT
jgi:hypothetical protein